MKKLLLTVTLSLACVGAFAQGKVNFQNNSLHLIYWDPSSAGGTNAGQVYLAGQGGQNLTIELWAGTSSTTMSLQSTTDFGNQAAPGTWVGKTVTFAAIAGGPIFVTVDIYDVAAGSYLAASTTSGHFYGTSGLFTMNASSTIAYNSIVNHSAPASSTWADGTYALDSVSPGFKGALMLTQIIPEPSTLALVGLSGAALMIFRRRK